MPLKGGKGREKEESFLFIEISLLENRKKDLLNVKYVYIKKCVNETK